MFPEGARRVARGVALDPPVDRILGRAGDAGDGERLGIDPGGMAVGGGEVDGIVRRHLVEQDLPGIRGREHRQRPASAADPLTRFDAGHALLHRIDDGLRGGETLKVAIVQAESGPEVDVGVAESRENHPGSQIEHLGGVADETIGLLARPDEDDLVALDGDGLGLRGRGHGVDGALDDVVGGGLPGAGRGEQDRKGNEATHVRSRR